ncbi:Nucleotidyltransferase domain protein [uncultured archaeon]|nr:Nucleotidyltransferase domain protein [uncultured archaeon]
MNRYKLIAYAMDFSSFLLKSGIAEDIKNIILFGSVARGDFDSESDIDIFVDTGKGRAIKNKLTKLLSTFEKSETQEKWKLQGLNNSISVKTGELERWELYRSIITCGILLYGKYERMPKDAKYHILFVLDFRKMERSRKIKIWRKLYGYRQKVGEKLIESKGFLEELSGKKIKRSVIAVPAEQKEKMLDFIKKYGINHKTIEIWAERL